jgi:hypothetical protein
MRPRLFSYMATRILLADTPNGDRRLTDILAGHELVVVRNLQEARAALAQDGISLVLVGVHFDDSRMFDLLRGLQDSSIPVACMRSHRFASPAIGIEGLKIATSALGCKLFVDLTEYPDDAQGNAAVRRLLESLIRP